MVQVDIILLLLFPNLVALAYVLRNLAEVTKQADAIAKLVSAIEKAAKYVN
ncbi:MAG TPA: hypothetical protein VK203_12650 [Nostocaceae cyanobacterium]|nr:hypothetical protein [Nostocaceae cyanobacterium]